MGRRLAALDDQGAETAPVRARVRTTPVVSRAASLHPGRCRGLSVQLFDSAPEPTRACPRRPSSG